MQLTVQIFKYAHFSQAAREALTRRMSIELLLSYSYASRLEFQSQSNAAIIVAQSIATRFSSLLLRGRGVVNTMVAAISAVWSNLKEGNYGLQQTDPNRTATHKLTKASLVHMPAGN
eukprot:457666-Amphidinium_carterae.1